MIVLTEETANTLKGIVQRWGIEGSPIAVLNKTPQVNHLLHKLTTPIAPDSETVLRAVRQTLLVMGLDSKRAQDGADYYREVIRIEMKENIGL